MCKTSQDRSIAPAPRTKPQTPKVGLKSFMRKRFTPDRLSNARYARRPRTMTWSALVSSVHTKNSSPNTPRSMINYLPIRDRAQTAVGMEGTENMVCIYVEMFSLLSHYVMCCASVAWCGVRPGCLSCTDRYTWNSSLERKKRKSAQRYTIANGTV